MAGDSGYSWSLAPARLWNVGRHGTRDRIDGRTRWLHQSRRLAGIRVGVGYRANTLGPRIRAGGRRGGAALCPRNAAAGKGDQPDPAAEQGVDSRRREDRRAVSGFAATV